MHIQEGQQVELRVKLCEGSSLLSRISLAVAIAALVLHVVSVGSSYWMEGKIRGGTTIAHSGLWQDCQLLNLFTTFEAWSCQSYVVDHHLGTAPAFFKVSQAFAILGILGHVATFVLLFIFTLLPKLSGQRLALFASITASAISGLVVLIAMSVYPAEYPNRQLPPFPVTWAVSWCFGLDFLSMVSSFAISAMLLWDFRTRVLHFSDSAA